MIEQQHRDVSIYLGKFRGIYDILVPNWNLNDVIITSVIVWRDLKLYRSLKNV